MRSEAPLTVRWASIWAGDQYIVRYGGRLTTSPFTTTSTSMSRPWVAPGPEVGQGLRVLAGQVDPGGVERLERRHPVRDRRRERLAEERAERHVLPGLDVARRPVVEPDDAEDVVGERVVRDRRRRASDGDADDEAELGLDVEPGRRAERRARVAAALPARPHDRRAGGDDGAGAAVVADRAGASSSAAAARRRAGRSGRRWWRGARRRRSRRSRRPRSAGAA